MSTETTSIESILNLSEAMTNLDGDAELLQEILDIFLETGDEQLQCIQNGIGAKEIKQVAVQAHGMKGGALNFCAGKFSSSALKLENLAKGGSLDGAQEMLDGMKAAFEELKEVAEVINWEEVERGWEG